MLTFIHEDSHNVFLLYRGELWWVQILVNSLYNTFLFSIEQSNLDEETLANLWSFVKSASVSPSKASLYVVLVGVSALHAGCGWLHASTRKHEHINVVVRKNVMSRIRTLDLWFNSYAR